MAMQINNAVVTGKYMGFFEKTSKDGKSFFYGQILQDGDGRKNMFDFRIVDLGSFESVKEGDNVRVVCNLAERSFQGGPPYVAFDFVSVEVV